MDAITASTQPFGKCIAIKSAIEQAGLSTGRLLGEPNGVYRFCADGNSMTEGTGLGWNLPGLWAYCIGSADD